MAEEIFEKDNIEKREKQTTIIEIKSNTQAMKDEFLNILKLVSPGTSLRAGLDGIVESKRGCLIILENDIANRIIDGGFKINARFTPQRLIELAKMDGAIVLSSDLRRIVHANVLLVPDSKIPSQETGTRHKAAERAAQMTGSLSIAISERKNQINLYYKELKYHLKDKSEILRRATETLQILEKQREIFDKNVEKLNQMEIFDDPNVVQAAKVIQCGRIMQKILDSQEKTIIELGNEAVALRFRVRELMKGVEKETDLVIKDYTRLNLKKSKTLLSNLSYEELIDTENILLAIAQNENNILDPIKGWRLLSKTKLSDKETNFILKELRSINSILNSKKEIFDNIIGEEKAIVLMKDLSRIKS